MTQIFLTKMKPKSRWIDQYSSDLDEIGIIENGVCKITELIAKPKSIWFIQHVISGGSSSDETSSIEDGEILSDSDIYEDEDQDKQIVNCKGTNEIHRHVSPECDNVITPVDSNGHFENIREKHQTERTSWKISSEKANGYYYHPHTTPGNDRYVHSAYRWSRWRANGDVRHVPAYKTSPKPDSEHKRTSYSCKYHRKPLIESPWKSNNSSSYDRYY